ncbi:MAG: hypothetical protein ABSC10_03335 [Candidatus Acidiferrales bacterium]
MKISSRISISTVAVLLLVAGVLGKAPRAAAQTGTVQFVARVTPSAGEDEPVRTLPFYLLSKSYADIQKEAEATSPVPSQDKFIDSLDVSKELKAWMKSNHRVNLSGEDFVKMVKADDIMNVPEFFTAYTERNVGDRTAGFPTPKYKLEDRAKDPAKYDRLVTQYHDAIRTFIIADPDSKDGLDLGLEEVNPGHKWDMLKAKNLSDLSRETADLARGKYLVARVETDMQGQGALRGIPPGNYWLGTLNIEAVAGDARERWDVPVTVRAGQPSYLTLTNINSVKSPRTSAP